MRRIVKDCRDVAIDLGMKVPDGPFFPVECCDSCHEDADEGYEDLLWYDDDTQVCCTFLRMLPDKY